MAALESPSSSPPPSSSVATRDKDSKLQIFLGGSCNPTTWRQNVAIPFLETKGISYYNPQVENWTPEVVDSERYAKQNAQILLFVIDKQTRSTVSLVESAFMAGERKNLVLVIYPFDYNILSIQDTLKQTSKSIETRSKLTRTSRIVKNQCESLVESKRSSSTLISSSSLAESDNLSQALSHTSSCCKFTAKTSDLEGSTTCETDLRKLAETREEALQARGAIKLSDEVISFVEFQELRQARYILQNLVGLNKIPLYSDINQALDYVSCCLENATGLNQITKKAMLKRTSAESAEPFSNCLTHRERFVSEETARERSTESNKTNVMKDVYLSVDCDDHNSFEPTVKSILKEQGLTYNYMSINSVLNSNNKTIVMPKLPIDSQMSIDSTNQLNRYSSYCESTRLAIEKEICTIKRSRVLLFVITNRCRGLSIMVLASHFMALFRDNVVLCVQYLEEPCSIGRETLTKTAIADYNRGRVYLCDYAIKSQVPVFSTVREAVECCGRKCRFKNKN